ncbi:hypothetical protein AVEN_241634-1 [Araneus ventricosus]|uniref:Uncharacterized protein n=1 Tax=Araneus ventricosus TaxID=182803 RepID=A0A4Y2W5S2_ARAVE|nr:hypothetical protein AVEN_241634-1 [Araneus ventricosus]
MPYFGNKLGGFPATINPGQYLEVRDGTSPTEVLIAVPVTAPPRQTDLDFTSTGCHYRNSMGRLEPQPFEDRNNISDTLDNSYLESLWGRNGLRMPDVYKVSG